MTSKLASADTRTAEGWGKEASKGTLFSFFFFFLNKWMGLDLCLNVMSLTHPSQILME